MTIRAFQGRDATLYILMQDGTFAKATGVRTTSMTLNNNPVDVTNADSGGFREIYAAGGNQQMDLTCEGLANASKPFRRLRRFAVARKELVVQYRSFTNEAFQCSAVLMDWQMTGVHNDVETFRTTIHSTGPITVKIDSNLYRANTSDEVNVDESDLEGFTAEDQVST